MIDYQLRRDARALPIYDYTTPMATLEPPPRGDAAVADAMNVSTILQAAAVAP